jgi:hypothetical protein
MKRNNAFTATNRRSTVRTTTLKLHNQNYLAGNMIVSCCPLQDIFEGMLFFMCRCTNPYSYLNRKEISEAQISHFNWETTNSKLRY